MAQFLLREVEHGTQVPQIDGMAGRDFGRFRELERASQGHRR